jgi:hypothetical protein
MSVTSRYVNAGIIRQLLRTSSSTPATTATATHTQHVMSNSTTTTTNFNWHQTRSYAVSKVPKAPLRKPPPAPKPVPSRPLPRASIAQLKKLTQILTPDLFKKTMQDWDEVISTLEPEEYCEHAMKYLEAVVNGADPVRMNLAGKLGERAWRNERMELTYCCQISVSR